MLSTSKHNYIVTSAVGSIQKIGPGQKNSSQVVHGPAISELPQAVVPKLEFASNHLCY